MCSYRPGWLSRNVPPPLNAAEQIPVLSHSPNCSFLPLVVVVSAALLTAFACFTLESTFVSASKAKTHQDKRKLITNMWELPPPDRPCACWVDCYHSFTVTKWSFENREVHQPASGGRPSTGRRLLQNTWQHRRRTDEANWHSDKGANPGLGVGAGRSCHASKRIQLSYLGFQFPFEVNTQQSRWRYDRLN